MIPHNTVNELKEAKEEETKAERNFIRMHDWMDELIKENVTVDRQRKRETTVLLRDFRLSPRRMLG